MRTEIKRERTTYKDQICAEVKGAVINHFKEINKNQFQGFGFIEEVAEYEEFLKGYYSGGDYVASREPTREEVVFYFPPTSEEVKKITFVIRRGSHSTEHDFYGIQWSEKKDDKTDMAIYSETFFKPGKTSVSGFGGEIGTVEEKGIFFRDKKRTEKMINQAALITQKILGDTDDIEAYAPRYLSIVERARNGLFDLNDNVPVNLLRTYMFDCVSISHWELGSNINFYEKSPQWKHAAQQARALFDSFEKGEKYVLGRAIDSVYLSGRAGAVSVGRFNTLGELRLATPEDLLDGFKNTEGLKLERPPQMFVDFLYKILH